jgi:hypothetical protein
LKHEDYANAISAAISCDISNFLEVTRTEAKKPCPVSLDFLRALGITDHLGVDRAGNACPIGSPSAKTGVVLEVSALSSECGRAMSGNFGLNSLVLPWGLKECGLTPLNSLIWTWNFRQNFEESSLNCDSFLGQVKIWYKPLSHPSQRLACHLAM